MTAPQLLTSSEQADAMPTLKSSGIVRADDHWAQPPLSHYIIRVEGQTFRGVKLGDALLSTTGQDELGYSAARMLAGEASADAGRVRPMDAVMSELRARLRG